MTIRQFFSRTPLERTVLIGYYGGGNFGDELLLEVLQANLQAHGVKQASFLYRGPAPYQQYHHDFGYTKV
ncbi:MAG TPA: hypothetical protein VLF67_02185, partial [Candidatus Saccharimonas sp.]|nr:hypothetical protein [Candidatus Saccharimonas sp.]